MTARDHRKPRVMSRRVRNSLIALVAAAAAGFAVAQQLGLPAVPAETDRQRYDRHDFTVAKVVDGDTLDLAVPDLANDRGTTRVRLWGVDTPETKHPEMGVMYFGPEAAAFAREKVLGKRVMVYLEPFQATRDKYKRLLAYIYLASDTSAADREGAEGTAARPAWMLNEQLIRQGYGYADERFEHIFRERFMQLHEQARRTARGLWREVTPEQFPAWYRRRHQ